MNYKRIAILTLILVLVLTAPFAQTNSEAEQFESILRNGIELFADGKYEEALPIFDSLTFNSNAKQYRADGAYWSAMTLLASGDPQGAEKAIDSFLSSFPKHEKTSELMYHRSRAVFLQKDYERAVEAFQSYLSLFPNGEYVPLAVFWSAESLYSLGRLQEAESLYQSIIKNYPNSQKSEASNYRLSLIQFRYREDELLTLLKWSHEESLRVVEEFQRRERTYEQALSVYQKRYGDTKRSEEVTTSSLEEEIAKLKRALDDLTLRYMSKEARVSELEKLISNMTSNNETMQNAVLAIETKSLEYDEKVLELKERALNLMQYYLTSLSMSPSMEAEK